MFLCNRSGWGLGEHNHFSKYTNWETDARVPMLVRVPWMPNSAGRRTSAIVEHVDLYPSLAELAGVPVDQAVESIDGKSWAGLMNDPSGKNHTKLVAYSQFPRCWPKVNPTYTPADYDRMERCLPNRPPAVHWTNHNMSFMGLSMRTKDYRYTEWHSWKGENVLRPDWDDGSSMVELYDHRADPPHSAKISFEQFENVNIAHMPSNKALVKQLGQQLREFFVKNEVQPKPSPPPPPEGYQVLKTGSPALKHDDDANGPSALPRRLIINGSTISDPSTPTVPLKLRGFNFWFDLDSGVEPEDRAVSTILPGTNFARLVMVHWQDTANGTDCYDADGTSATGYLRQECLTMFDAAIKWSTEAGLWTILTARAKGAGAAGSSSTAGILNSPKLTAQMVAM